ncbi:AMP-binding protein [Nocardia sp. NPDC056611]|uniref:AMP-binding protein n=1 Tax=Nocardia sp. NPDC056611 TaxID=3345877 RepID=UPI003670EE5C
MQGSRSDRRTTYRDLDRRSNQLAHLLIELRVVPDAVLAVGMPCSPEWVLAVTKRPFALSGPSDLS